MLALRNFSMRIHQHEIKLEIKDEHFLPEQAALLNAG